ncbi:MAG TPA: 1-deoxy-D-xylulose-5-phosphate synthase [bacterium]
MTLLERIARPADLKSLKMDELEALAKEVREELVTAISELGGHLASSLGAVELCLALHYVFDAPEDHLLWDMGYQAYTHKLITGRRERFRTLKRFRGLSGFNNKDESPYDLFLTGHGGTVLSTAFGLAMARDEVGGSRHVVSVIGDASLGEGMALEALNHIGHLKPNLLVILNDNKMSISKPIGGLSRYLNRVITNPTYNRVRADIEHLVQRLPAGSRVLRVSHRLEDSLKGLLVPGQVFQDLGFRYVGPVAGHSLRELIRTLRNIKRLKGPILLHVVTTKGKGYKSAEQDPERFHKTEPFDIPTGRAKAAEHHNGRRKSARGNGKQPVSFTDAFSEELVRIADGNPRVLAITAAMPEGTGLAAFAQRHPERFIDVGMAEQHAVGLAAGLATGGMRPVVAIYSTFLQRAFDQIMHEVCLQRLPVVLAADRAGLVGEDGPTHHGVFDTAYLRILPNLTVMSPRDPDELRAMLRWALEQPGPVALRYSRGGITCGEPLGRGPKLAAGRAELLREGRDVTLAAIGSMVYPAMEAAERLAREGVSAAVVNARFIKPVDADLIGKLASATGRVVTIEESQVGGGFGSAVSEALGPGDAGAVPLLRLGLPDVFVEHGTRAELLELCRLTPDLLAKDILRWLRGAGRGTTDELRLAGESAR